MMKRLDTMQFVLIAFGLAVAVMTNERLWWVVVRSLVVTAVLMVVLEELRRPLRAARAGRRRNRARPVERQRPTPRGPDKRRPAEPSQ